MENIGHKYLVTGEKVLVHKKIKEGFLVSRVFVMDSYDEDEEYSGENTSADILLVGSVYDSAPTAVLDERITALNEQIETLEKKIEALRYTASQEKQLLGEISKYPILHQTYDYLTGAFTHIVWWKNLEIVSKDRQYAPSQFVIMKDKEHGLVLVNSRDGGFSWENPRFKVFKSEKDAQDAAREELVKRIKNASVDGHSYILKGLLKDIHFSCIASKEPEIIKIHAEALAPIIQKENQKRLAELEDQRRKLEEEQLKLSQ